MSSTVPASAPVAGVLRTPDERFQGLPDFPFEAHYIDTLPGTPGLRVHYLDEGPTDAVITVLCLHGQPSWSYLYRKMLPVFVAAGQRVVAPDLYGFGRSDKPTDESFYTFSRHRQMLLDFVRELKLVNVTLVCQDWGGLLGLTLPPDLPGVLTRAIIMNTGFGTGDIPLGKGFLDWRAFSNSQPDMNIAGLMKRATPILTDAEADAYAAPYPDATYKAGVRRFPNLVPDNPNADGTEASRRARTWWQNEWSGKSFMAIGMKDPVLGPAAMKHLHQFIRGCPAPMEVADGGHFVQEWGADIARAALKSFGS